MGSKRSSSSKNRSKDPASNPLVDPPAAGNPGLASLSKSSKKLKLSSGLQSPRPSADSPASSEKSRRKAVREEDDNIPLKASTATTGGGGGGGGNGNDKPSSQPGPLRWANGDVLKLLKAVVAFRFRNGIVPTLTTMPIFLKDIKDWAPKWLSEKQLYRKLANLRRKFQASPTPGPDSSEFDRKCYKLAFEAWGVNEFDSVSNGAVKKIKEADVKKEEQEKKAGKKAKEVKKEEENEEDEEGEIDHGKTESSEMEDDDDVEDGNDQSCFKYLQLALEEFWTGNNLDMNALKLALQRVDLVQAKHLNKRFWELLKEELKLKMEKNQVDNSVLHVIQDGVSLD